MKHWNGKKNENISFMHLLSSFNKFNVDKFFSYFVKSLLFTYNANFEILNKTVSIDARWGLHIDKHIKEKEMQEKGSKRQNITIETAFAFRRSKLSRKQENGIYFHKRSREETVRIERMVISVICKWWNQHMGLVLRFNP